MGRAFSEIAVYLTLVIPAVLCSAPATAAVDVFFDTDLALAGIQNERTVFVGEQFSIGVGVKGVEPSSPLAGFQVSAALTGSSFEIQSQELGAFLFRPAFELVNTVNSSNVVHAVTSLQSGGVSGTGIISVLTLNAASQGSTEIAVSDVVLSQPFGIELAVDSLSAAMLNAIPVPVPGSAIYLVTAFAFLMRRSRR